MSEEVECRRCGGTGYIHGGEKTCPTCNGSGVIRKYSCKEHMAVPLGFVLGLISGLTVTVIYKVIH